MYSPTLNRSMREESYADFSRIFWLKQRLSLPGFAKGANLDMSLPIMSNMLIQKASLLRFIWGLVFLVTHRALRSEEDQYAFLFPSQIIVEPLLSSIISKVSEFKQKSRSSTLMVGRHAVDSQSIHSFTLSVSLSEFSKWCNMSNIHAHSFLRCTLLMHKLIACFVMHTTDHTHQYNSTGTAPLVVYVTLVE